MILHQKHSSRGFDKPRSLGKKLQVLQSVIRIEGMNPFSDAVAGEAIATPGEVIRDFF